MLGLAVFFAFAVNICICTCVCNLIYLEFVYVFVSVFLAVSVFDFGSDSPPQFSPVAYIASTAPHPLLPPPFNGSTDISDCPLYTDRHATHEMCQ